MYQLWGWKTICMGKKETESLGQWRTVVKYALSKTILRKSFKIYRNNQNTVYF